MPQELGEPLVDVKVDHHLEVAGSQELEVLALIVEQVFLGEELAE